MKKILLALAALGATGFLQAQVTRGTVTYDVRFTNNQIALSESDRAKLPPEVVVQLQLRAAAASQSFELSFDGERALYQKSQERTQAQGSGAVQVKISGSDETVFNDFKARQSVARYDISGESYIVADSPKKWPWQLQPETKKIGGYTCHKATLPGEEQSVIANGVERKMKGHEITAWYTLEIPVPAGPSRFNGLPGLILSVDEGLRTISFAGFSPDVRTTVAPPAKGKKVTPEEFRDLQRQQFDKMKATAPAGNSGVRIETMPQH